MRLAILLALIVLVVSGCADHNVAENAAEACGRAMSGFWGGLWHGFIAWFGFIGSLLDEPAIGVYDVCNNGGWYDLGFCLGIGVFGGGAGGTAAQARR